MDAWRVVGERSVDAACESYTVLESCRSSSSPCEVTDILFSSLLPSWRVALVAGDRGLSPGLSRALAPATTRSELITCAFHCETLLGYQTLVTCVHWSVHGKPRQDERAKTHTTKMSTKSTTRTTRISKIYLSIPHSTHFQQRGSARVAYALAKSVELRTTSPSASGVRTIGNLDTALRTAGTRLYSDEGKFACIVLTQRGSTERPALCL